MWVNPSGIFAKRLSELEIIHPGFEDMFNEFKLNLIELNTNHKYNTGEKSNTGLFLIYCV